MPYLRNLTSSTASSRTLELNIKIISHPTLLYELDLSVAEKKTIRRLRLNDSSNTGQVLKLTDCHEWAHHVYKNSACVCVWGGGGDQSNYN